MSITREQRERVLHLRHIEAVSLSVIVEMTGLAGATVRRVLSEAEPYDAVAMQEAAATRPSSKDPSERAMHAARGASSKRGHHDRT